jgi:hypothetical protein
MNRLRTEVIKARELEITVALSELDQEDMDAIRLLAKQGAIGYDGQRKEVKVTSYLTVHNVLAISSVTANLARDLSQNYLVGDNFARHARVTIVFIIDAAKVLKPVEEKSIANDTLELPTTSVKELK